MHVLILPSWYPNDSDDVSGVFFRDQAQALSEFGHKVGVISVRLRPLRTLLKNADFKSAPSFQNDEGILTYRENVWKVVSRLPYSKYWLWRFGANQMLKRYIAEQGMPDVIHAHAAIYAGKVAAEWNEQLRIPVVLTEHSTRFVTGGYKPWQLRLAREAAAGANARVAVSPPLRDAIARETGQDAKTWHWIPNMVASRFSRVAVKSAKEEGRPIRLLCLAVMRKKKGHEDLLQAFASAFPQLGQAELWLGGDGPVRQALEERVHAMGLADRVFFFGNVPPKDVPSLLAKVDMFVLASHWETFGVVVAEALTVGVPSIATRCGGPECIIEKGDGIVVEPGSPASLAAALKEMAAQLAGYDRADIRVRALARFSGKAVADQLTSLYQQVCRKVSQE